MEPRDEAAALNCLTPKYRITSPIEGGRGNHPGMFQLPDKIAMNPGGFAEFVEIKQRGFDAGLQGANDSCAGYGAVHHHHHPAFRF
ncbi:MAG: hypothetical protein P1U81_17195 [Verrucomicrobiales bacterium]|nr:hypothetical protein [Verrucomicrobiales bacterium]